MKKVFTPTVARYLLFAFTSMLLFSACIGPARLDKWVAKHYGSVPAPIKKKSDIVNIRSNLPSMDQKISESRKKKGSLLPLIVYWKWTYGNTCNLNPQMALNSFTTTATNQAARTLKQKLNGQTIELTIEKLPAAFDLDDVGHAIFLIYVISWETVKLRPNDKEVVVSYKVYNNSQTVTKSGSVSVPFSQSVLSAGLYQSVKKKTWQYLEEYDAGINSVSKKVIDEIASQL
jgi:hypothetical protein